jgi:hypothetical protein
VPYYITVSEGEDPGHTTPVLAVSDPAVVGRVLAVITRHFGSPPPRSPTALRPVPDRGPGEERES